MIDRRIVVVASLCASIAVGCGSTPTDSTTIAVSPTPAAPIPTVGTQEPAAPSEDPAEAAYEAVLLRLEVVDGSPEVLAVGVDSTGHERQIGRLPDAWVAYRLGSGGEFLAPAGAVSTSGLLAIPVSERGQDGPLPTMRWEIFDLHRPEAAPIVVPGVEQGLDQIATTPYLTSDMRPGAHWAAGERLGIPLHSCDELSCGIWSFFDGRTGAAIPGRPHAEPSCRTRDRSGADIAVFDGGVVRRDPDGSREELVSPSGVEFACLAPDDSMVVHSSGMPPSSPVAGLISLESGARFAIEGNFAGWLAVDP